MVKIIDIAVRIILYIMFFSGVGLLFGRYLPQLFKSSSRYKKGKSANSNKSDGVFIIHIRQLLRLNVGRYTGSSIYIFIAVSASMFILSLFILLKLFGISLFSILGPVLLGALPYAILRIRLTSLQLEGSYEAEALITELTNMYRINNLNMLAAIEASIASLSKSPHSKRSLFHLSLAIKNYRTIEELSRGVDDFVAGTGTEWARLLGINIIESIVNGTDVSKALDDILSELKEIKSIIEKDRRANNEAFTLVKFIVPAVYILSVYGANKFFGFTLDKFFSYQFTTALGIKFFMAIIFLSAISFVAMFILKKPKFDY